MNVRGRSMAIISRGARRSRQRQTIDLATGSALVSQSGPRRPAHQWNAPLRISAIVDACFRLIVDGKKVLPRRRRGSAQELVAYNSILWLECTTRSRMASARIGSLR